MFSLNDFPHWISKFLDFNMIVLKTPQIHFLVTKVYVSTGHSSNVLEKMTLKFLMAVIYSLPKMCLWLIIFSLVLIKILLDIHWQQPALYFPLYSIFLNHKFIYTFWHQCIIKKTELFLKVLLKFRVQNWSNHESLKSIYSLFLVEWQITSESPISTVPCDLGVMFFTRQFASSIQIEIKSEQFLNIPSSSVLLSRMTPMC